MDPVEANPGTVAGVGAAVVGFLGWLRSHILAREAATARGAQEAALSARIAGLEQRATVLERAEALHSEQMATLRRDQSETALTIRAVGERVQSVRELIAGMRRDGA